MLSGEATNTNFLVFGMTRPGLKSTIYHTRGKHANHYATDAVDYKTYCVIKFLSLFIYCTVLLHKNIIILNFDKKHVMNIMADGGQAQYCLIINTSIT
jgi:hypothetical protein